MICLPHNSRMNNNCLKNILTSLIRHKCLWIIGTLLLLFYTCTGKNLNNNEFDYLIFSQRWLPSSCVEYVEKNPRVHNHCKMLDNYDVWAIHGLWPTQNKTLGPFFCNNSMKFDVNSLQVIIEDLRMKWPNIEGGKGQASLWKHEWLKHGTCAAQLESLNSELKYFNTTLGYFGQFNLNNLFEQYNVQPTNNKGYQVMDIFNMVKKAFGKNPHINCITEVKTKQAYLSEIRLCFSKDLKLMDCEEINDNKYNKFRVSKTITNCPLDSVIIPDNTNTSSNAKSVLIENWKKMPYYDALIEFLNIIQFLQWASI